MGENMNENLSYVIFIEDKKDDAIQKNIQIFRTYLLNLYYYEKSIELLGYPTYYERSS